MDATKILQYSKGQSKIVHIYIMRCFISITNIFKQVGFFLQLA